MSREVVSLFNVQAAIVSVGWRDDADSYLAFKCHVIDDLEAVGATREVAQMAIDRGVQIGMFKLEDQHIRYIL